MAGSNKPYHGMAGFLFMEDKMIFSRCEMLLGSNSMELLKKSKVAIFGIGGVGSFVVEALTRCGVGKLVLIDNDVIDKTNINRQIHANINTVGKIKVEVMKERIIAINPDIEVTTFKKFYCSQTSSELLFDDYDYVVDAIDSIESKINLILKCKEKNIPIISSMGAANKLDPTKFKVGDIYNTSTDPIAKKIRKELRKNNIESLKVVYSTETPIKPIINDSIGKLGSVSFVPSVAGLIIGGEVICDLIKQP